MFEGIILKLHAGFLRTHRLIFCFTVNLMFSLGMEVTGCGGRGCYQSSENKNSQSILLLFHGTCCGLSLNSVLKEYEILFHDY